MHLSDVPLSPILSTPSSASETSLLLNTETAPSRNLLMRFFAGLSHDKTKFTAGALTGAGLLTMCMIAIGVMSGGAMLAAYVLIGIGVALFVASTAASISKRSPDHTCLVHITQSWLLKFLPGLLTVLTYGMFGLAICYESYVQRQQRLNLRHTDSRR